MIDSSIYSIHVLVSIIFLFRKAIYAILDSVQNPLVFSILVFWNVHHDRVLTKLSWIRLSMILVAISYKWD